MTAFYNDPETFRWLSELIAAGEIMRGPVHTGSIADLRGKDLAGFTRVHLFAGIGGWDLALQLAGWPDDAEVWTGSCPCQPFSTAGKQKGTTDDRHLWPEMRRLIAERSPTVVFGENVASRAGRAWLAGVRADLEALGYAVGAADLCAAGAGAPHIRQRLYWGAVRLADADIDKWGRMLRQRHIETYRSGEAVRVADADRQRRDREPVRLFARGQKQDGAQAAGGGATHGLGDSERPRLEGLAGNGRDWNQSGWLDAHKAGPVAAPGESGFWDDCEIVALRDGTHRRTQRGLFPLVDGIPAGLVPGSHHGMAEYVNATSQARAKRLRGYGNAIVPQVAATFVRAFVAALNDAQQG